MKGKPTTAVPIRERDLDKNLRDSNKEEMAIPPSPAPEPPAIKPESKDGKKDRDVKSKETKEGKEGEEDDPQLQKATDLLKSWMIFKELRPAQRETHVEKAM